MRRYDSVDEMSGKSDYMRPESLQDTLWAWDASKLDKQEVLQLVTRLRPLRVPP